MYAEVCRWGKVSARIRASSLLDNPTGGGNNDGVYELSGGDEADPSASAVSATASADPD